MRSAAPSSAAALPAADENGLTAVGSKAPPHGRALHRRVSRSWREIEAPVPLDDAPALLIVCERVRGYFTTVI